MEKLPHPSERLVAYLFTVSVLGAYIVPEAVNLYALLLEDILHILFAFMFYNIIIYVVTSIFKSDKKSVHGRTTKTRKRRH
jgi:hypothetical protein